MTTAPSSLYVSLSEIPTKCLQAIQIANDRFKEFGHSWDDCIFGTATQVVTGKVCGSSLEVVRTFNLSEREQEAFHWIFRNWDAHTYSQEALMAAIEVTLRVREDNADGVTYTKDNGKTVRDVVTIKRGNVEMESITDADIYTWLNSLPKETVDA